MSTSLSKTTLRFAAVVVLFTVFAGYSYLRADTWTSPTANPPLNNVERPITVGTSTVSMQVGNGNLGFDQSTAFDQMNTDSYCNLAGTNCYNPVDVINLLNASATPASIQTTLVPNWPDALVCTIGTLKQVIPLVYAPYYDNLYYYEVAGGYDVEFNLDGSYYGGNAGDCTGKSITQLAANKQAFSFNPEVFIPGTKQFIHLPDRGTTMDVILNAIGNGAAGGSVYTDPKAAAQVCSIALPGSHPVGYSTHAYRSEGDNSVWLFSSTAKAGYVSDKHGGWWQQVGARGYNTMIEDLWCQK